MFRYIEKDSWDTDTSWIHFRNHIAALTREIFFPLEDKLHTFHMFAPPCNTLYVLYYIVLYILLYYIVLYCIVLYCIVFHVLYCIILYFIILHCIAIFFTVVYFILLHCVALYCTALFCMNFLWKLPNILTYSLLLFSKGFLKQVFSD